MGPRDLSCRLSVPSITTEEPRTLIVPELARFLHTEMLTFSSAVGLGYMSPTEFER